MNTANSEPYPEIRPIGLKLPNALWERTKQIAKLERRDLQTTLEFLLARGLDHRHEPLPEMPPLEPRTQRSLQMSVITANRLREAARQDADRPINSMATILLARGIVLWDNDHR